jgi:hypothetical protein
VFQIRIGRSTAFDDPLTEALSRSRSVHWLVVTAWLVAAGIPLPPPLCKGKNSEGYDPKLDRSPGQRALAEVQTAYDVLCPNKQCGVGELFENVTIGNNAITFVSGLRDGANTRAKIVYSAPFLDTIAQRFGSGASFGILAHEVGHHLTAALALRQTTKFDNSWNEELRADYLAGCALGRSGHSAAELDNALRALATVQTASHPDFNVRTQVVGKGYGDCRGQSSEVARNASKGNEFGIGAALRQKGKKAGCWGYWYRAIEDVDRVGPIAAKRKRSKNFTEGTECEAARKNLSEPQRQNSEGCTCE